MQAQIFNIKQNEWEMFPDISAQDIAACLMNDVKVRLGEDVSNKDDPYILEAARVNAREMAKKNPLRVRINVYETFYIKTERREK